MAKTPELPRAYPESVQPQIKESQEEFPIDENLQAAKANIVKKNFTAQIKSDKGQPLVQTPPTQVVTVQPPAPQTTLNQQAKGSPSSSLTWLAAFWIRVIKKALHFGWKVLE